MIDTLLVLGGSGVMGRRIVRLAREHRVAARVLAGGRRARGDTVRADVHDRGSLDRALEGVGIVINAVGPFDYDPAPLLSACAERGAHYADIAETERFAEAVRAEAERWPKTVAVSGASTLPGTVEVLAQRFASLRGLASVRAFLGVGTANEASATLLASMLGPVGRPLGGSKRAFDTMLVRDHRELGRRVYGRYPSGADSRGLVIGGMRVPLELFFGFDRAFYAHSLGAMSRLIGAVPRAITTASAWALTPIVPIVRALGTSLGVLRIEAVTGAGSIAQAIEIRAERGGLDVPALPAVWAAQAIAAGAAPGARRLAELVSADDALDRLEAAGFEVRVEPGEDANEGPAASAGRW